MEITPEYICEQLGIDLKDILNIYPYGSRVYGTFTEESDYDFVIVYKKSLLPSGAFKDNAISSKDYLIQGSCYSRGGFQDAINNFQITALECLFLSEDLKIQEKKKFDLPKMDLKQFTKKIITTASSSWHFAKLAYRDENLESSRKNVYHALRILDFGLQIKEYGKIMDFGSMNETKIFMDHQRLLFKPKNYHDEFIDLSKSLKK